MNFKNLAENLIIVLISVCVGGVVGFKASTISNKQTIELLRPTIEQAIKKETTSIKNEFKNSFKTEIKKLKAKKGSVVEIPTTTTAKPDVDNTITQEVVKDTVKTKKRKKFLGVF